MLQIGDVLFGFKLMGREGFVLVPEFLVQLGNLLLELTLEVCVAGSHSLCPSKNRLRRLKSRLGLGGEMSHDGRMSYGGGTSHSGRIKHGRRDVPHWGDVAQVRDIARRRDVPRSIDVPRWGDVARWGDVSWR